MRKIFKKITILTVLVFMTAMLTIPAAAMDFSVRAVLPENQRQNGSQFFDIIVRPGQEQELMIEIVNLSDVEIVVLVETLTASTSRNGQINYTSRGELDESMKYSFEDLVQTPESYHTIPAESSIHVPITLSIPDGSFDGAMLGSIRVLKEVTQEEKDAAGAVVNQFAHVTAVRIIQSEDAESLDPDFLMGDISAELVNYRASIIANIRNPQPMIIKGARATATIYERGSNQAIFEHTIETLDFAPNSIFPFSFIDREGYGISAGDYTAKIDIEFDGRNWSFDEDFTIEPQVAAAMNERAVNQTGQMRPNAGNGTASADESGIPMWAVIAIAAGAAVFTALIALVIVLARRKPAIAN